MGSELQRSSESTGPWELTPNLLLLHREKQAQRGEGTYLWPHRWHSTWTYLLQLVIQNPLVGLLKMAERLDATGLRACEYVFLTSIHACLCAFLCVCVCLLGVGYFDVRPVGLDHTERGHGFVFQALRARAGSVILRASLSRKGSKEVLTQRPLDFLGVPLTLPWGQRLNSVLAWPRLDEEAPPQTARLLPVPSSC